MVPLHDGHHVVHLPNMWGRDPPMGGMMRANEGNDKVINDDTLYNPDLVNIPLPVA